MLFCKKCEEFKQITDFHEVEFILYLGPFIKRASEFQVEKWITESKWAYPFLSHRFLSLKDCPRAWLDMYCKF